MLLEVLNVYREYSREAIPLTFWMSRIWHPLERASGAFKPGPIRQAFSWAARAIALGLTSFYPKPRIQGLRKSFQWYAS
jgi:hypothetical protein